MNRLPADVSRHVADLLTAREALALLFAGGRRGCNLTSAFREANTLRRVARVRNETDAALFSRWDALPGSLHEFVLAATSQPERLLAGVFRGAARAGVAALSRVDVARLRIPGAGRARDERAMIRSLRREFSPETVQMLEENAVALGDDSSVKSLLLSLGIDNTTDSFFAGAIGQLASARAGRGRGAPQARATRAWIARHALTRMPASPQTPESHTSIYTKVADLLLQHWVFPQLGAPSIGGRDIALVYDRVRIAPLADPALPGRDICDACLGHDGTQRRALLCCRVCDYALCGACCGRAQQDTHECAPRLIDIGYGLSKSPSAYTEHVKLVLRDYFSAGAVIDSEDRLRANEALHARIKAQEAWVATAAADRLRARAQLARARGARGRLAATAAPEMGSSAGL
ncbi:hypothetical protein JL720_14934 [Aureococcus anophagefferens]|nr:hypothetical protein JL720_14934 [Aureococcus anophagefferens]